MFLFNWFFVVFPAIWIWQIKRKKTGINYSTGTALKYFVRTRAAKCYKFDSYSLRLIKLNL